MKLLIPILVALCASFITASAATINLAWSANPAEQEVVKYTVYEFDGTTYTKLVDTVANTAALTNVTPGVHTYVVTAWNVWLESDKSLPVTTPPPATAPQTIVIVIVP